MLLTTVLLVVLSGFMNSVWNLNAKRSRNKQAYLALIVLAANIALLPVLLFRLSTGSLPPQAYPLLAMSAAAQAAYAFMLSKVYAYGDLSQVYPIQRGTGVLLIPLIGVAFMGEKLSAWGWGGVSMILLGILTLSKWADRRRPGQRVKLKPVLTAIGVGLCITSYVLVDKFALRYVEPMTLIGASNFGFLLGNTRMLLRKEELKREWTGNRRTILLGSVLMPGSYFLFLAAMELAPVSHLAPIREVGTVFAAILGIWILKEKGGVGRLIAAAAILMGILLIGTHG
ncbi:EamA family transporter [Cohnella sp. LGH]|uniref:DMT family transporter n=1 Tax=Cohnella sp. LGH TaxID=1619153 RepID=UPI001ADD5F5D|nr:DMT family transporter [Cohnella sp. LGH]QTH41326.1 EamA family transporter [Cohnella sp. LGH]